MNVEKSLLHLYPDLSWSQSQDMAADVDAWRENLNGCANFLKKSKSDLREYTDYCRRRNLATDDNAVILVNTLQGIYGDTLRNAEEMVDAHVAQDLATHAALRRQTESTMRSLHQLRMPIARAAAWVSEAYDQSTYAQEFNSVNADYAIKYDRYESARISKIEREVTELVGLGGDAQILATSSGMAAYQMIDGYLRSKVLVGGDTVLVAHPLYSEVTEGMLKGFNGEILRGDDLYDAAEIVNRVVETGAKVVYADPMKNRLNMRLCDIDALVEGLKERCPDRRITLVVDGTMTTGSDRFFKHAQDSNVDVLYYSSCCKYMQLGQDCVSAGFAAFPEKMRADMEDIRRVTGTILYDTDAWVYPEVTEKLYVPRMERMTRNALVVGSVINETPGLQNFVEAVYPGLPGHPDYELSRQYRHTGSLLTFRFKGGNPTHEQLNAFVSGFINHARKHDQEVVNGESFGFSIPRLYVGWTPSNQFPPFLRLSAGDRTLDEARNFAHYLKDKLMDFGQSLGIRAKPVYLAMPERSSSYIP